MNSELCDIKNMFFQVMTYVRHLEEDVAAVKQELNELKSSQKSDDWGEKSENRGEKCGLSEAELIKLLTGENVISALKNALQLADVQSVAPKNASNTEKDESKKEEKVSPTPLSKEKKVRKKKKNPSSRLARAPACARPEDFLEIQSFLEAYCKRTKRAIPDKLDGEAIFEIMDDNDWLDKKGQPIDDWKKEARKIIRYRSDVELKEQQKLLNKARLENLRHKNIMEEKAAGGKRPAKQQAASTELPVDRVAEQVARSKAEDKRLKTTITLLDWQKLSPEEQARIIAEHGGS